MKGKLLLNAALKYALGVAVVDACLFLPAGTLAYWNAWLLMCVLFLPMLAMGIVLAAKQPQLLEKRLNTKEPQKEQKAVTALGAVVFVLGFAAAGLGRRFGWNGLPGWVSWLGAAVFLAAYGLYAEVMRENAYLSRTVEIQQGQKVIDTGLYGAVRHPMYAASILMFLAMPLTLGSLPSLVVFMAYPVVIARRISAEEAFLEKELDGYAEYKTRVRYKVIPFLW